MNLSILPQYLVDTLLHIAACFVFSILLAVGVLFSVHHWFNCYVIYYILGIIILAPVLSNVVSKLMPKRKISPSGKAVFITGCDSGFGHMLAQNLDRKGLQVFAGCLFPDGNGANSLRQSGSSRLHVIGLDVTDDTSVQKALEYVKENLKGNVLWAVVNNAGIAEFGEIHWTPIESIQRIFEVNTMGVVRVTKAFLPLLKESKGRVIAVASLAGRYSIPLISAYSMSKASVISFCDGLRVEMYRWGVQVITIEPGVYRTPILIGAATRGKELWEKAPSEIKAVYPENCMEQYLNMFSWVKKYFSKDPTDVILVMDECILSLNPKFSYAPGKMTCVLLIWTAQKLPKPVADMILLVVVTLTQWW